MSDEVQRIGPWAVGDKITPVMNHDEYEGVPGTVVNLDLHHGWRLWVEMLDGEVLYVDPDDIDSFAKSAEEAEHLEKIESLENRLRNATNQITVLQGQLRRIRTMLVQALSQFGGITAEFDHNQIAVTPEYAELVSVFMPRRESAFLPHFEVKEDGSMVQNFNLKSGEQIRMVPRAVMTAEEQKNWGPTPLPVWSYTKDGAPLFPTSEQAQRQKAEWEAEQEDRESLENIEYDDGGNPR